MAGSTGGIGSFVVGLGLGIACGVALGRLYTPYRGSDVRTIAQERISAIRGGANDTLTELKDRVNSRVVTAQLAAQDLVGGVSNGPLRRGGAAIYDAPNTPTPAAASSATNPGL